MPGFQDYRNRLLAAILPLAPQSDAAGSSEHLPFTRPPQPELGDLALAVFPLAKALKRNPAEVARQWADAIRSQLARDDSVDEALSRLEIPVTRVDSQGPYLNLTLDPPALARFIIADVASAGARYGWNDHTSGQTVMVEYSNPNTNKPLHLGHVRNNLLGMAISNILEAVGDRVIRVNLINDRGIHICKSMLAYQRWGGSETPRSTGEKGDHFVGRYYVLYNTKLEQEREGFARARGVDRARFSKQSIQGMADRKEQSKVQEEAASFEKEFLASSELNAAVASLLRRWEAGDAEVLMLWQTMNGWVYDGLRRTYARLGCRFDKWYFESQTWTIGKQEVERGLASGIFYRHEDGSVWARLSPLGLQDKVLLRRDGTAVYITQDLGTARLKFEEYHMDRSIYVVASEQDAHFKNLFAILKLLGYPWAERCHHASYGMVTLPGGMGKLKSREGTSVDADDLLDVLKDLARRKIQEGNYCETPESAERTAEIIGQGAIKLYILQVSAEKNIEFDPTTTINFAGDTGPAVQYSHARIHGILRKGLADGKLSEEELGGDLEAKGLNGSELPMTRAGDPTSSSPETWGVAAPVIPSGPFLKADRVDAALLDQPEEREVLRLLADFPDLVGLAARQLSPAPVATALLDLTKAYARMYHQHEVLRAATPELLRARVQLALCVAQVLRNGLGLLTIEAPKRM